MDLVNQTVSAFEDYLRLVKMRYDRGIAMALEVYQARTILANSRAQRSTLEELLATVEHSLAVLVGRYPGTLQLAFVLNLPDPPSLPAAGLPSELLQMRPDLQAAYSRLRASDRRWAQAVASRYPSFNLSGTLFGFGAGPGDLIDPEKMIWNALGGVAMPVFAGGALRANADRAAAEFDMYVAAYREAVLNAFRESEDALVSVVKKREFLKETARRVEAAEGAARIAHESYLRGVIPYVQVILAETELFNARRGLITARRENADATVRLFAALGGGWTAEALDEIRTAKRTKESVSTD